MTDDRLGALVEMLGKQVEIALCGRWFGKYPLIVLITLITNQTRTLHLNLAHWQRRVLAVIDLARQTLLVAALADIQKQFAHRGQSTNPFERHD